jgi:hypothetical protein
MLTSKGIILLSEEREREIKACVFESVLTRFVWEKEYVCEREGNSACCVCLCVCCVIQKTRKKDEKTDTIGFRSKAKHKILF